MEICNVKRKISSSLPRIYLFERIRKRDISSTDTLFSATKQPGLSQLKPVSRNCFQASCVSTGAQYMGRLLLLFPGCEQGAGVEVERLGIQLEPTWDASATSGGFTHHTTKLCPEGEFLGKNGHKKTLKELVQALNRSRLRVMKLDMLPILAFHLCYCCLSETPHSRRGWLFQWNGERTVVRDKRRRSGEG